jgi:hypothetical protein
MKTISLEEYKNIRFNDIKRLEDIIISCEELKYVLTRSWFWRLRNVVNSWDDRRLISDGAYNLFRILSDEFHPARLDRRLSIVAGQAKKQSRLRSYRKTRGELASVQTNQILGSLFEINIVYAALQSCSSVEVFPVAGNCGSDVEAKLIIDNRPIYIEAKALTYSNYDLVAPLGSHSVDSMIRQIYDALNAKLSKGKQLHVLSANFPTTLFLALGFNADEYSGPWGIESYYQKCHSNVSSIFLFGSALCRELMKAFHNENSSFPLSHKEREFFENSFYRGLVSNNDA